MSYFGYFVSFLTVSLISGNHSEYEAVIEGISYNYSKNETSFEDNLYNDNSSANEWTDYTTSPSGNSEEQSPYFRWLILERNSTFYNVCKFALSFSYYSTTALIFSARSDFTGTNVAKYYQNDIGPVVLSENQFYTEKVTIMFLLSNDIFYNCTASLFRDLTVFYVFVLQDARSNLTDIFSTIWNRYRVYNCLVLWRNDPNHVYGYDAMVKRIIKLDSRKLEGRRKYHLGKFIKWFKTELKTVVFARAPSLVYDMRRGGMTLKGYDGMILTSVDKYLNVSLFLYHTTDEQRFGYVLGDGTFVGTMKDVVDRTVDFTGNAHFVKWYNVSFLDFTHYVTSEKLCISVPEKGKVPNFFAIFQAFDSESGVLLLCTYGTIGVLYALFKLTYVKMGKYKSYTISTPLQMFLLSLGGSIKFKGHLLSEKLLLGPLFITSLFTVNTFQGTLMTLLTAPSFYRDMDTLKELRESRTPIWTSSKDLSLLQDLGLNIRVKTQKVMIDAQNNSDIGRIIRFNILSGNKDTYGGLKMSTPYHIVKECLGNFYVSYILPKGSPVMSGLNWLISTLVESGIIVKWIHESDSLTSTENRNADGKLTMIFNPFVLSDLFAAFLFLSIGTVVGAVAFAAELSHFHLCGKTKKGKPLHLNKTDCLKSDTVLPYLD